MFKNIKKISFMFIVLFVLLSTTCLAATVSSNDATLEIVENNICTINIQNIATFEKTIISSNLEKKELTLGLKVTNTTEPIFNKPSEIFLVIDNSLSMRDEVTSTANRLKLVTDSAKNLATELLKNENVKIGVVSFSTGENEGTLTDATLKTTPTAVKETVLSSITEIAEGELGPRTNIDAGITLANQNFSKDCKSKYLILLTDGVPNTAVGGPTFTYSGETATKTKAKLQSINNSNVTIFSVMTGVPNVEEPSTGITYKALAEEIFGTMQEPTVGKFYYISDSQIENTICNTILNNFTDNSKNTLTNLKIYDYFPQEIVDNFDFSYVADPTIGTISPSIDLQNNMIVWTIDKLEPGNSATVSYKLKLKDNIDTKILDVVLDTNDKVEITADEIKTDDGSNVLVSEVTPKVKVTKPKEVPPTNETPKDNTITNTVIPQTGNTPNLFFFIAIAVTVCSFIGIRYYELNRKLK